MTKLAKEFFADNEILFWDQTKKGLFCPISKNVVKEMQKQGIKVALINKGSSDSFNIMRKAPRSAYVLCEKNDAKDIVTRLEELGIQRILFHPFLIPEENIINTCRERHIEIVIGCPNMVLGKRICKIHASLI